VSEYDSTKGAVEISTNSAAAGTVVEVTIRPASDYVFTADQEWKNCEITGEKKDLEISRTPERGEGNSYGPRMADTNDHYSFSFIMPDADVIMSVIFVKYGEV
jgi:hypothetical protein